MPRKRRAGRWPELYARNAEITSFAVSVSTRVEKHRGGKPTIESGPWLELRGKLEEPVKGVENVLMSMYPKDRLEVGRARPASVGAVIGLKPQMSVVLPWSHRDFDRVWALAAAGCLRFAYLCVTKPHYGKGLVVSASFSNEREE